MFMQEPMALYLKRRSGVLFKLFPWIFFFLIKSVRLQLHPNVTSYENGTSVERSVSVSFDNTKIYFFGDKIEFAGEVHNRYPDGQTPGTNTGSLGVNTFDGGEPIPPGLRPFRPLPRVHYIDAECQNDYMKISILFNGSFTGLIYSSKYAYNPDCLYVNGTGAQRYEFYIRLNRCGTLGGGSKGRSENDKKMMWNTLTVQYNPLIEEEWDQHFRVTCEYGYQFWKKVSFPVVNVNVPSESPLLFTLSPPECQMEIRMGFDLNGRRVTTPVNVGDPLTLVIYMRSPTVGFDLIINNCIAHNGANKRMLLIDDSGCPVESKIISDFKGVDLHHDVYESKVYAYFKAFRFTGSPALYVECDVRMCHGICPKQRCYWRNLRGRDEVREKDGRIHSRLKNQTLSEANSKDGENSTEAITTRRPEVGPPSNSSRSAQIDSENRTTTTASPPPSTPVQRPTGATLATPSSTSTSSTRATSPTTQASTTVTPKPRQMSTLKLRVTAVGSSSSLPTGNVANTTTTTTSTTTALPVSSAVRAKADLTSTVNLNIHQRRSKRTGTPVIPNERDNGNNTISETVNLFQALEVRSEPAADTDELSLLRGREDNYVCLKTVSFTAIICVLVLVLILVASISCMLCARMRRLQGLDGMNLPSVDKYYNRKDFLAALRVHRTS